MERRERGVEEGRARALELRREGEVVYCTERPAIDGCRCGLRLDLLCARSPRSLARCSFQKEAMSVVCWDWAKRVDVGIRG